MAIKLSYTVTGSGPAIFLIHGIGARRAGFDGIVARLKANYTCIAIDLRGHGESPLPDAEFNLEDLADDIEAVRQELGIEKVHLAGHSLGGMIGPAYARKYPDHTLSVSLLSTAAFRKPEDREKLEALGSSLREKGVGDVVDVMTQRWFTEEFAATNPSIIERRKQQVLDTPEHIFINVFEIYARTEMSPWLHEVKAPTLVLTGEFDGGCNPVLNRQIADALPNAKLVILEGMKHAVTLESPWRVATEIETFLANQ